jgi:hypothetical protein
MRHVFCLTALLLPLYPVSAKAELISVWDANAAIGKVQKSVFVPSPGAGQAAWVDMRYVGSNLELMRIDSVMSSSDALTTRSYRTSTNNGQTWSVPHALPDTTVYYQGNAFSEYDDGPMYYDSATGTLAQTWLRRRGNSMTTYSRVSADHGATWSTPEMLRYEAGNEFDPNYPLSSNYLTYNQSYFGNSIIKLADGKLLTVVGDANTPAGARVGGMCFTGSWNASARDYDWAPSNRVSIASNKTPALDEPDAAQLKDGHVLVVWRGTNTSSTAGHKWYSLATSDGASLSSPTELRYDDGSEFYSPSSFQRLIRSTVTGDLYWIGNISATAPNGNSPRYPLVIAEVNESGAVPSLMKNTVTLIDDWHVGQSTSLQLSNFSLLENRETHHLDLYLAALGENPNDFWGANCYKYSITIVPEPSSLMILGTGGVLLAAWSLVRRRKGSR